MPLSILTVRIPMVANGQKRAIEWFTLLIEGALGRPRDAVEGDGRRGTVVGLGRAGAGRNPIAEIGRMRIAKTELRRRKGGERRKTGN
jgi:hypothetical protein